jgi:cobyrinic acid a,c-diamide synthase
LADPRGVIVAAPASGAGKTLVTLALIGALRAGGRRVASAKVGPDYIDPRFHAAASGRDCVNLDPWAMRPTLIRALASEAAVGADLLVIEGVMGLFDGAEDGSSSTADLAALLGLPVLLVVDARRQAHSVAALVKGFSDFRADCHIAGIILNRVASPRHRAILETALAPLDIPVLGALKEDPETAMPSRHLGLVQAEELEDLLALLDRAAASAAEAIDLERCTALAAPFHTGRDAVERLAPLGQRIALASDRAFGFTYPHLLGGWTAAGAELRSFSPLADEAPDADADAVFLPGGYPELHAGRIAQNETFLAGLRRAADRGALIYGECGGFMVLGEALIDAEGRGHAMAGLLPVETSFAKRRLHLGYRHLKHSGALPWPEHLKGHEFHYSTMAREGAAEPLFSARDSVGRQIGALGLRRGRVMGSYAHVIDAAEAGP